MCVFYSFQAEMPASQEKWIKISGLEWKKRQVSSRWSQLEFYFWFPIWIANGVTGSGGVFVFWNRMYLRNILLIKQYLLWVELVGQCLIGRDMHERDIWNYCEEGKINVLFIKLKNIIFYYLFSKVYSLTINACKIII